jgi:hypothetical protein
VLAERGVEVDHRYEVQRRTHRGRVVIAGQHRSFEVGDDRNIDPSIGLR